MKLFFKTVLAAYVLFLLWLILFKFSADPFGVLSNFNSRSLNLAPFADAMDGGLRQMIENLVVFVPLGLLLSVVYKEVPLWRKLAFMFGFSLVLETLQYAYAIGATDITDVIMNTEGGLFALMLYDALHRHVNNRVLDWCIAVVVSLLLLAFMWLRIFVVKVMY